MDDEPSNARDKDHRPRDEEHRPYSRRSDYRMARIGAGAALTFTLVAVVLIDAISTDYEASPVVLGILSTMILTLFGIEAAAIVRGHGE